MLIIDGQTYGVGVISISRKADFLDKYANRTEDGKLQRELIGVYFNYQMALEPSNAGNAAEYQRLWDKLTEPVEFHSVVVPYTTGEYTFVAYFSGVGDTLYLQKQHEYFWKDLKVDFIAKDPARK